MCGWLAGLRLMVLKRHICREMIFFLGTEDISTGPDEYVSKTHSSLFPHARHKDLLTGSPRGIEPPNPTRHGPIFPFRAKVLWFHGAVSMCKTVR